MRLGITLSCWCRPATDDEPRRSKTLHARDSPRHRATARWHRRSAPAPADAASRRKSPKRDEASKTGLPTNAAAQAASASASSSVIRIRCCATGCSPADLPHRANASPCPRPKSKGQTSLRTSPSTMPNSGPAAACTLARHCQHRTPAGSHHALQLAHRSGRIRPVHQAQVAQCAIEAGIGESQLLGIHARETGVRRPVAPLAVRGGIHHGLGDVDTDCGTAAPATCAAAVETTPVPQATSSTDSPAMRSATVITGAWTRANGSCQWRAQASTARYRP